MKCGSFLVAGMCVVGSLLLAGQSNVPLGQKHSASTEKPQGGRSQSASKNNRGPIDILTDTGGVDFRPFLRKSIHKVRTNWYNVIPAIAKPPFKRKGEVVISFRVMQDGKVENAQIHETSGDDSLDKAARQAIIASNPLPALPAGFACKYADLRFHFYYNPDTADPATGKDFPVLPCVTSIIHVGGFAGLGYPLFRSAAYRPPGAPPFEQRERLGTLTGKQSARVETPDLLTKVGHPGFKLVTKS